MRLLPTKTFLKIGINRYVNQYAKSYTCINAYWKCTRVRRMWMMDSFSCGISSVLEGMTDMTEWWNKNENQMKEKYRIVCICLLTMLKNNFQFLRQENIFDNQKTENKSIFKNYFWKHFPNRTFVFSANNEEGNKNDYFNTTAPRKS